MDDESQNYQREMEQNRIHPRNGQFVLVTLCQRFTTDFRYCIFNTDAAQSSWRQKVAIPSLCGRGSSNREEFAFVGDFVDETLAALCSVARMLEQNMALNQNLLFPPSVVRQYLEEHQSLSQHPVYGKVFPNPNQIALTQLGELVDAQSSKLLQWTRSVLDNEDWIGGI